MTYRETLAYIYGLGRFGMRPGLEKISKLLSRLGNPQDRIKSIHVAGTNGKGSTCAFLASIIEQAGYKAGLFTSPHLVRFNERIRINGVEITPDEVTTLAKTAIDASPPETTFFELVTAMAWLHFANREVDFAVMETGMGGRFDATNAAPGILSVITPISIEHSRYLGETIGEIAFEKAGIIKPGKPVVTSRLTEEALEVIAGECSRLSSPLFRCGEEFGGKWTEGCLSYEGIKCRLHDLRPGLMGRYQSENAFTALASAEILECMGVSISEEAMVSGIQKARWPGRMELVGEEPRILLDGAHNPASAKVLAEELRNLSHNRLLLVIGIMSDKDVGGILNPLIPYADKIYAVAPPIDRAMPSETLAELIASLGGECDNAGEVTKGLEMAKTVACPGDLILVCGSLFTIGEARAYLFHEDFEPFRG
jgi:dihydrofolate synthase/folylpolyglutamate synthase